MKKTSLQNRESNLRQTARLGVYAKTALQVLAVVAGVATLAVFPGLALVVREYQRCAKSERAYSRRAMRMALRRLEYRGYVRAVPRGSELSLQLTREGRRALKKLKWDTLVIPKPPHWDGKWHFIAFDIPEKQKTHRDLLRGKLEQLGCVMIQKSLFVHPHPCEHEVAFLAESLGIGQFVHLITAISFNGDRYFRKQYGLS